MPTNRNILCNGVRRRDFLRMGSLSALGLGFMNQARASASRLAQPKRNCILIWLDGGASHLETFDPKPEMPVEVRGPLGSISTALPGIRFGECLPRTAKLLSKMTLLRGVTSPLGEHNLGAHYMLTGYPPSPAIDYPSIGSAVSFLSKGASELPGHIAVPNHRVGGGYLRANGFLPPNCSPFELNRDVAAKKLTVRDLDFYPGLDFQRVERRVDYVRRLDQFSRSHDRVEHSATNPGMDQALKLIQSQSARQAFELEREPANIRGQYSESFFGQCCLLARRLVEAGSRFVTVNYTGWDTHDNLVTRLKDGYVGAKDPVGLIPNLDRGLSALVSDLDSRGLLDETLVLVMGEFGRTPKINSQGGRDHWPRVFSVLMAGAGVPRGSVIGTSDATGESPLDGAVTPADIAATVYKILGFDPDTELTTPDGRPVRLSLNGKPIRELVNES